MEVDISFALVQGLMYENPESKAMTIIDGTTDPSSQVVRFDDNEENGGRMNDETDRWSMELLLLVGFPRRRFDLL